MGYFTLLDWTFFLFAAAPGLAVCFMDGGGIGYGLLVLFIGLMFVPYSSVLVMAVCCFLLCWFFFACLNEISTGKPPN